MVLRVAGALVIYLAVNTLLKLPFDKAFLEQATLAPLLVRSARYAVIMFLILGVYPRVFPLFERVGKR